VLFFIQDSLIIRTGTQADNERALVWSALFGVAALTFLWAYITDRHASWWAVIPGTTLLGLAAIILLGILNFQGAWIATLFLASMSAGFWVTYLGNRDFWWAVIPGGTIASVAALPLVGEQFGDQAVVATLFFGLAATFALVYALPAPYNHTHMIWALIPAAVFALMGLSFLLSYTSALAYIWPLGMIIAGIYILFRRSREHSVAHRS
jgi:hypothetical protein